MSFLVFGCGGHARVVVDLLRARGESVAGFLDDDPGTHGRSIDGIIVRGSAADAAAVAAQMSVHNAALAVGDNLARHRLLASAVAAGLAAPPLVHPSAVLAGDLREQLLAATGGEAAGESLAGGEAPMFAAAVIMARAVVQAGTRIGRGCIINTGACIDHDCTLEDFCHIAPAAVLTGRVRVCSGALMGAGAVVLPGRVIGKGAIVGAGAVVTRDVAPGATVMGNPARPR